MDPRVVGRGLGRGLVVLFGLRQFRLLHRLVSGVQVLVDRLVVASAGQRYGQRGGCRQRERAGAYKFRAHDC